MNDWVGSDPIRREEINENFRKLDDKVKETDAQLAEIVINVKNYGAKGDGVTDDTQAIKNAINALGVFTYAHPQPANAIIYGGGTIYFPKGKYKVTDTLKYASSMTFKGVGWSSIISFRPTVPKHLFEPDSTKYGAWNSMHDVTFEDLQLDGDGNIALDGIRIFDTRMVKMNNLSVSRFRYGIYNGGTDIAKYRYFQSVINCRLADNVVNLYLEGDGAGNGVNIIGGEITHSNDYNKADYEVIIKCSGVSFISTAIQGRPNIAHVYDLGTGTAYLGVYTETTQSQLIGYKPFIKRDASKRYQNSMALQGIHNANNNFLILYEKFEEDNSSPDLSYDHTMPDTVSFGSPVEIPFIRNKTLTRGLYKWTHTTVNGTVAVSKTTKFNSDGSLEMTNNGSNNVNKIRHVTPLTTQDSFKGKRVFLTMLVKRDGNAQSLSIYAYGAGTQANPKYFTKHIDYGNGWVLYVCDTPLVDTSVPLTIDIDQKSLINGAKCWVTNVQSFIGGYNLIPAMTPEVFKDAALPTTGEWIVGDVVINTAPTAAVPTEKWLRVTNGTGNILGTDWIAK